MFSYKIISKILAGGLRLCSGKYKKFQGLKPTVLKKQRFGIKEDLVKESEKRRKQRQWGLKLKSTALRDIFRPAFSTEQRLG